MRCLTLKNSCYRILLSIILIFTQNQLEL